jgi:hypothetical protein
MAKAFSAAALAFFLATSLASRPALAAGPGVDSAVLLHAFDQTGNNPYSGPALGPSGTLFGTVPNGGNAGCFAGLGCGAVYELIPGAGGTSPQYSNIYLFTGGADGGNPTAKPTVTNAGIVYGYNSGISGGGGIVFALSPPAQQGQPWTFVTIYNFASRGGSLPYSGYPLLYRDKSLYGLAGTNANAVFQLSPPAKGGTDWTETTLYTFKPGETVLGLVSDGALGFFAITAPTQTYQGGRVVSLNPPANGHGKWTQTTIASFHSSKTFDSPNGLIAAPTGNLYLIFGKGIYELTPPQSGSTKWPVSKIATLKAAGYGPSTIETGWHGSLIVTIYGDQDFFGGVVFQLTPPSDGGTTWTPTLLTNFNKNSFPSSNPIDAVGAPGNVVYGAVNNTYDNGAVFGLYPPD